MTDSVSASSNARGRLSKVCVTRRRHLLTTITTHLLRLHHLNDAALPQTSATITTHPTTPTPLPPPSLHHTRTWNRAPLCATRPPPGAISDRLLSGWARRLAAGWRRTCNYSPRLLDNDNKNVAVTAGCRGGCSAWVGQGAEVYRCKKKVVLTVDAGDDEGERWCPWLCCLHTLTCVCCFCCYCCCLPW